MKPLPLSCTILVFYYINGRFGNLENAFLSQSSLGLYELQVPIGNGGLKADHFSI